MKKIGLDLLCVAAHYSKRYESADHFIENKSDEELKAYTYYLKHSCPNNIVVEFCNKYIIDSNSECKMEWKNLHFVWKQFLSNCNLPNVIYYNSLKNILKEKYTYVDETDSFMGITSKYLPVHSDFIKFWENTITIQNIASDSNIDGNTVFANDIIFDNEFEIDELCSLFKYWSKQNIEQLMTNGHITEENILKILKHFFPVAEIIEDKFVLNINCSMWNKMSDINASFEYIKQQINSDHKLALISFDDAYNYYYKFCNLNSFTFIVSKRYFEKYLYFKLSDHIVYEKFIETEWAKIY